MINLNIRATDNIQDYLDILEQNGGGILNLATATYVLSDDISVPTNTIVNGNGATLDFNSTTYGLKIIGTALDYKINCSLQNLTVTNSTSIGIECDYANNNSYTLLENITVTNCDTGLTISNSIAPRLIVTFENNNANCEITDTSSISIDFCTFSGALTGDGLVLTGCTDSTVFNSGFDGNALTGIKMTDCSDMTILSLGVFNNGSDGIKLVSGNSNLIFTNSNFGNNGGYGINIVDNTSSQTLISTNTFDSDLVNDNGTGTLIRSNIGVIDN